ADRQDGSAGPDGQDRSGGADGQDRPAGADAVDGASPVQCHLAIPHGVILAANRYRRRRRERMVNMAQPPTAVYALLADGTTVETRPAGPADFDAVKAMHEAMSPDNSYLRFFHVSRLSAEIEARRISGNPVRGSAALLAVADGEVVGVASYVPLIEDP